jgi:CubicO group peptidase (beta-lactamase class C family)
VVPATEILAALRYTEPQHPFRSRFTYVNPGHTANALAAGRITGQGFPATLRERILRPLGMTGTSGGVAARDEVADQAAWHTYVDGAAVPIDTVYSDGYLGAGGIVVSGSDAVQWLRFHLNGGSVDGRQLMARGALAETHRPQVIKADDGTNARLPGSGMEAYALGWTASDLDGHPLLCHAGSDLGIAAMTILLPAAGVGVAVYTNSVAGASAATAFGICGALLGLAPRDWSAWSARLRPSSSAVPTVASTEDSAQVDVAPCAGVYVHPADGVLRIERSGDRLHGVIERGYRMDFDLEACEAHRFVVRFRQPEWRGMALLDGEPQQLVFEVRDGRVSHATLVAQIVGRTFERVR